MVDNECFTEGRHCICSTLMIACLQGQIRVRLRKLLTTCRIRQSWQSLSKATSRTSSESTLIERATGQFIWPNLAWLIKSIRISGCKARMWSKERLQRRHQNYWLVTRTWNHSTIHSTTDWWLVIGEPNYLKKATRSDISYVVHQCTWFVSDLKVEHGEAVQCLGRYLKGTNNKGAIMRPVPEKELEVFVNASFCGDWDPVEAARDRDTAQSWHGYIINYAGCPLLWKTQLQTEVALLSTENEYTGLSSVLRDDIPIMQLLKEMKEKGFS